MVSITTRSMKSRGIHQWVAMKALGPLLVVYVFLALSLPFPVGAESERPFLRVEHTPTCDEWSSKILAIEQQPQKPTTSWCWAAAAHNVMEYVSYRNQPFSFGGPRQCEMAEIMAWYTPRDTTCCDFPVGESQIACQTSRWPEQIMDVFHFSYSPPLVLDEDGTRSDGTYWPIYWSHVKQQICSDHPYISVIGSDRRQTHAVVVHGFYQATYGVGFRLFYQRAVQVYDPLSNDSYSDFGRYSSRVTWGSPTGVTSHGEKHFADTYNINEIPLVLKGLAPAPALTPTPPVLPPLPEVEGSTSMP